MILAFAILDELLRSTIAIIKIIIVWWINLVFYPYYEATHDTNEYQSNAGFHKLTFI